MDDPTTGPMFRHSEALHSLMQGNGAFVLDLYRKLGHSHTHNVFFSPASITLVMALTFLGSQNKTASQIKEVLRFTDEEDLLHECMEDLLLTLSRADQKNQLHLANRLYAKQQGGSSFLPKYLQLATTHYKANPVHVEFNESTRKEINRWIAAQTGGKINNALPAGALSLNTITVLVNAIYFKSLWASEFDTSKTRIKEFLSVADGSHVKTHMMMQESHFQYGFSTKLDAKVVALPYVDQSFSMYVLLPKTSDGMRKLEENLRPEHMLRPEEAFRMRRMKVHISLPRLKFKENYRLKDTLASLGIVDLFSPESADLSNMDGTSSSYVSDVFHQAFIEVNEEGSEAAAATTAIRKKRSLEDEETFNANHPFLFFIRHNPSEAILFLGRFMKPEPIPAKDEL